MDLHRRCRKCSKLISADEEFLYDGDIPLHISCYTCSQCQQSLAGRFYYRWKKDSTRKRLVCDTCYFRLVPVCFHCLKIIEEISLVYGERVFHPRCFRCDQCQTPFDGALLFPYGNHLYCVRCYSQVQTDFQPISTNICLERCERCRKQFQPGDLITEHRTDEKRDVHHYLHNSCFVCEICHENLSNSIYYSPKDPLDLQKLTFQWSNMSSDFINDLFDLFQPSDDRMVVLNHRWYHEQCFACRQCRYPLKDLNRVIIEPDGFLCERCLKSIRETDREG